MSFKPMDPKRDELMAKALDDMISDAKRSIEYFEEVCDDTIRALNTNQRQLERAKIKLELLESIKGKG